jgi:hypothetical protein
VRQIYGLRRLREWEEKVKVAPSARHLPHFPRYTGMSDRARRRCQLDLMAPNQHMRLDPNEFTA